MPRSLKTTGLAAEALGVVALDDDGVTLREWVNGWSSVTSDGGVTWTNNDPDMTVNDGVLVGSKSWKGAIHPYFHPTEGSDKFKTNGISFAAPIVSTLITLQISAIGVLASKSNDGYNTVLAGQLDQERGLGLNGDILTWMSGIATLGTTVLPTDGATGFTVAANYKDGDGTADMQGFVGLESGALALDATVPNTPENVTIERIGARNGNKASDYKAHLWVFFDRYLTEAEAQSIHNDPFGVFFDTAAADTTPPTVSAATATATGETTADVGATSNEDGTGYMVIVPSGATAPSAAQIIAGTDASDSAPVDSGQVACTANAAFTIAATGLTAGTTYDAYVTAEDGAGLAGNVVTASVTTTATLTWADIFADQNDAARANVEIIGYFWDTSGWNPSGTPTTQAQTTNGSGNASFTQPAGFSNNPCLAQFVLGDGVGTPTGPSSPLRQVTFA